MLFLNYITSGKFVQLHFFIQCRMFSMLHMIYVHLLFICGYADYLMTRCIMHLPLTQGSFCCHVFSILSQALLRQRWHLFIVIILMAIVSFHESPWPGTANTCNLHSLRQSLCSLLKECTTVLNKCVVRHPFMTFRF